MTSAVRVVRDTYCDSLRLLVVTAEMSAVDGVSWAGAVMGAPAGLERLADAGIDAGDLDGAGASDMVLAVIGEDSAVGAALDVGARAVLEAGGADAADGAGGDTAAPAPRSVEEAARSAADANVAIVSVPGAYAAIEAHHALSAGLHVLLFSDNVPLDQERELKERALGLGLLVMGPGAGTAVLGGTGLGFANEISRGPVGVVAAAGTGAQEVSALLSRWGVGVSQVIGVGGRDLGAGVGGLMTAAALRTLDADPGTDVILVVSKPPDPEVATAVLTARGSTPAVATFLGVPAPDDAPDGVQFARTLEQGAVLAARRAGRDAPALTGGMRAQVAERIGSLAPGRRTVHGFFSGGTLCYEAQLILGELLGNVWSNEPLVREHHVPAPPGAHVLLDLGAEEYTDGRPHPMIDPGTRIDALRRDAAGPGVAVVLLDVVLGHGSHRDPAGELLPALTRLAGDDGGPAVIAYVLGSDRDPQDYREQRSKLESIGCLVTETAARAAYAAAAIAARRPDLALGGR